MLSKDLTSWLMLVTSDQGTRSDVCRLASLPTLVLLSSGITGSLRRFLACINSTTVNQQQTKAASMNHYHWLISGQCLITYLLILIKWYLTHISDVYWVLTESEWVSKSIYTQRIKNKKSLGAAASPNRNVCKVIWTARIQRQAVVK